MDSSRCDRKTDWRADGTTSAASMARRLACASSSSVPCASRMGPSTLTRNIDTTASAMRASDEPITRPKWRVACSPKSWVLTANAAKLCTSRSAKRGSSGSTGAQADRAADRLDLIDREPCTLRQLREP